MKKQFEKDFGTGSNAKTELTECARFFMISPRVRQNGFVRPESAKGPGSAEAEQHAYLSDDLMGDEGMHYMIMICPFLS